MLLTVGRQIAKTMEKTVSQQSANGRPTVGQQSADSRWDGVVLHFYQKFSYTCSYKKMSP